MSLKQNRVKPLHTKFEINLRLRVHYMNYSVCFTHCSKMAEIGCTWTYYIAKSDSSTPMVHFKEKSRFTDPNKFLIGISKGGLRIELAPSRHVNVRVRPKIARKESTVLASEVLGQVKKTILDELSVLHKAYLNKIRTLHVIQRNETVTGALIKLGTSLYIVTDCVYCLASERCITLQIPENSAADISSLQSASVVCRSLADRHTLELFSKLSSHHIPDYVAYIRT
jgi:hypothetical protein